MKRGRGGGFLLLSISIGVEKSIWKALRQTKGNIPEGFKEIYERWQAEEITAKKTIQKLDLKPATFYKLVKEYKVR